MVEWSATTDAVCGFGDRDTVALAVDDWRTGGNPPAVRGRVDAIVAGTTGGIRLPTGDAVLVGADERPLPEGRLPDATHEVRADAGLEMRVAFEGPATVEATASGPWLRFPDRTPVAVGFRDAAAGRETVTVPPTPAGVAAAVTAAARTHRTEGPARSHPGFRPHTPRVVLRADAPVDVEPAPSRPTLSVPPDAVALLVAAPLSYYLGADLTTADGAPTLRADGLEHVFEPLPAFAGEVGDALRRLCGLDARIRDVRGETGPIEPGVDAGEDLADAAPVERLAAVIAAAPDYPGSWPLSTYVDDDFENARYLPSLLDNLSLVHPAEAAPLEPRALLKRSLDEFYRGETAAVDAVDPALADARHHAWRGAGTPVEAYTLLGTGPAGHRDRFEVDVVCNEAAMQSEGRVADVYRRRLAGRPVDVRVHERLTTADLASVFERGTDLVHFIGHCEVEGLVCPDGTLAAMDLDSCGASAFFLNACGSYLEGHDLVGRGATVGAVTLTEVLDEQAMTVGTTFADLLANGFAFARALSLARGEILAGRDYVVVGDGTHRLRPPRGEPGVFRLERAPDGFAVTYDATAPDAAGHRYRSPFASDDRVVGVASEATLAPADLRTLFERHTAPVRFEGDLRWTDELLRELPEL